MIETLDGTDRYLITRVTTDNPDVYEGFPPELKATISEVHRDIGIATVGTYGIDLDEENLRFVVQASNVLDLRRIDDHGLGYARAFQLDNYDLAEEMEPISDLVEGVPIPWPSYFEESPETRTETSVKSYRYYNIGPILDQGREGACTGFGVQAYLNAAPIMSSGGNREAQRLYHRARQIDEWEGEDYEGSSISAATRAAVELGTIGKWGFARSRDECLQWKLGGFGGIIYGMNWYEGMYVPNAEGFLRPTGKLTGGHCLFDRGVSRWMNDRPQNSWGRGWGEGGLAWFLDADMRAMWRRGEVEAIMATQIKR